MMGVDDFEKTRMKNDYGDEIPAKNGCSREESAEIVADGKTHSSGLTVMTKTAAMKIDQPSKEVECQTENNIEGTVMKGICERKAKKSGSPPLSSLSPASEPRWRRDRSSNQPKCMTTNHSCMMKDIKGTVERFFMQEISLDIDNKSHLVESMLPAKSDSELIKPHIPVAILHKSHSMDAKRLPSDHI